MANVEAGFAGDPIARSRDDSLLNPGNTYYDAVKDGVRCTLCHQVAYNPTLGTSDGFSSSFSIDTNNTGTERKIYGLYEDKLI